MKFAHVLGHAGAVTRLRRAVERGRVAGSYLLAGPTGIGKRQLADAFTMALLCEAPAGGDACGACVQCTRVLGGAHPDVLVVDREEDRRDIRTEQIRDAIKWFALRPLMAQRKIALIDGAEFLNDHGQNALLKTLEEPRGQAILILVAAAEATLLPTVRSRCQIIRCDPLPLDILRTILEARGIPGPRAELLAAQGHGSVARALALDDETHAGLRAQVLGTVADLPARTAADLSALAQDMARGPDAGLRVLLSWYHDLLRGSLGAPAPLENPDHRALLLRLAPGRDTVRTLRQLALVCDTIRAVEHNANRVLAIETLLLALREIEWTHSPQPNHR